MTTMFYASTSTLHPAVPTSTLHPAVPTSTLQFLSRVQIPIKGATFQACCDAGALSPVVLLREQQMHSLYNISSITRP
jgi:hypothetical protein